jgi:predicted amidohydrolase
MVAVTEGAKMRVTVCELPHEPEELEAAWEALCRHTVQSGTELVLLPEFAMVDPLWEWERFDAARWAATEALSECWLERLGELSATYVIGTRPVSDAEGGRFNEGFLWRCDRGVTPLRRKCYLPDETRYWEARWFDRGEASFPGFSAGSLTFGLNICTELWSLETYGDYAASGVQVIMSPRATETATMGKWLSVGVVAAVRSGAYSISSNRVDSMGTCGGMGWVISPDGAILAVTTPRAPFATVDIDLGAPGRARKRYPCYVFESEDR